MAPTSRPRVALIHATPLAIAPIEESFRRLWPEAEPFNLLDDSLSPDLERAGGSLAGFGDRLAAFAQYASGVGARGVLFTCSAFGPAIEACRARLPIPVLKPNEAMIDEALEHGTRIALVATFEPALRPMAEEFRDAAARRGASVDVATVFVADAMAALRAGDVRTHDALIAETVKSLERPCAVCLAQFSMTSAAEAAARASAHPVLTTPDSAVKLLRRRLHEP